MAVVKGKRQAEKALASKSKKVSRLEGQQHVEKSEEEGLFDNLDEEMDPSELENIMQQLNDQESSNDSQVEEEEMDAFDDSKSEEEEDLNEEELSPSESEEEEEQNITMEEQSSVSGNGESTAKKFRDYYMTKMTQAFGTDLDQIRQEPTLRVNMLIDSLEAGISIYSNLEQEIILADEQ